MWCENSRRKSAFGSIIFSQKRSHHVMDSICWTMFSVVSGELAQFRKNPIFQTPGTPPKNTKLAMAQRRYVLVIFSSAQFFLLWFRSRPGKPNQRKGQNEKFMNFAHFCEFWCFSLGKQARFTLNFCSRIPLWKVHELTFLWFGLPGPLLNDVVISSLQTQTCNSGHLCTPTKDASFTATPAQKAETDLKTPNPISRGSFSEGGSKMTHNISRTFCLAATTGPCKIRGLLTSDTACPIFERKPGSIIERLNRKKGTQNRTLEHICAVESKQVQDLPFYRSKRQVQVHFFKFFFLQGEWVFPQKTKMFKIEHFIGQLLVQLCCATCLDQFLTYAWTNCRLLNLDHFGSFICQQKCISTFRAQTMFCKFSKKCQSSQNSFFPT